LRSPSLRNRLVLGAGLVLVIALGLVGLALNAANHRGAVAALQARMEPYVYLVLAAMKVDRAGRFMVDEEFADPRLLQPGSGVYLRVEGEGVEWHSKSALGLQLPSGEALEAGAVDFREPATGAPFYSYRYGIGWQLDNGRIVPFTVTLLVDPAEIEQQTSAFRLGLWRSLGAAGAILVLAQLAFLVLGFRPLGRVAADVARVESGRAERLDGDYPRELEPLVRNVNRLLETEKSNQQRIRNALDSLAHSLKTPLAVIQVGLPLHGGDGERSMQNAVEEMKHLIATRLERAGSTARRSLAEPVAVAPQLQRIVDSLNKVHSRKVVSTEAKLEDKLVFYGERRDLLELLGNLLDNAFKYGRSRVRVRGGAVEPGRSRPGLWLCVEDDGPGIDETQWSRLLQRGARGDERVEGHGLGLAIVTELVAAYGGTVGIGRSDLGGAEVRVNLPAS
jgi:two-component system, OmpR family, sensor histidine kinase PhoQ